MILSSLQNELHVYYVIREMSLLFQSSRNGRGRGWDREWVVGVKMIIISSLYVGRVHLSFNHFM